MTRFRAVIAALLLGATAHAEGLTAARLGVLYNLDEPDGGAKALAYAQLRSIPVRNLAGVHAGNGGIRAVSGFDALRDSALNSLPSSVESLVLIWARPWAVGCMSVTSAFAAGYRAGFCEPGCADTTVNPLFDAEGWLPADTIGWWPAMLMPAGSVEDVRRLARRGMAADGTAPKGTVYLVTTKDGVRNIRAATYPGVVAAVGARVEVRRIDAAPGRAVDGALGYFTGAIFVDELPGIHFLPGAVADHLTSSGGMLDGGQQMSAGEWLRQGATASYGSVSEPCATLDKFPNVKVLMKHYLRGETVLEAYWKSVAMAGQGLFIGEPLARPFAH